MNFYQIKNSELNQKDEIVRRSPKKELITSIQTPDKTKSAALQFETQVLNFLFKNKEELSIAEIYSLKNVLADCFVVLENGVGITIEFKSLLNWEKSNVARSQMLMFKFGKYYDKLNLPDPDFGVVIFGEFDADWGKILGNRNHENGWSQFYWEQKFYDHLFKIRLSHLKNGQLQNPFVLE
jgi:hypothetical protein